MQHIRFFISIYFCFVWTMERNNSNPWNEIFQIISFHLFMNICYFIRSMEFIRICFLNWTLKHCWSIEPSNLEAWIKPNGYKMNLCKHKQRRKLHIHDTRVKNSKAITKMVWQTLHVTNVLTLKCRKQPKNPYTYAYVLYTIKIKKKWEMQKYKGSTRERKHNDI